MKGDTRSFDNCGNQPKRSEACRTKGCSDYENDKACYLYNWLPMECGPVSITDKLTQDRGANYGPPIQHFPTTQGMYEVWLRTRENTDGKLSYERERVVRHGVYMILDKLARAAHNPMHLDDWDDVMGYASCVKKTLWGK